MVSARTLYHEAWAGDLPIGIMGLLEAVKRKCIQTSGSHAVDYWIMISAFAEKSGV